MSGVSVRGVDVRYGGNHVLHALDLEIASGEFIVLLGPSGCGKSTLLNAIAGLLDVTDGEIWIGGQNVTWAEPSERGIGMVFQSYALYPGMTVAGNLSFGLRMAGTPRDVIRRKVTEAARTLQIEALMDRRPAQLSGGQRQRVAIGRALVRDAGVFLFDEPLSNLDAKLRTELRVQIKRLHKQLGATMVFVTHDQIEALTLADRIAVMHRGSIQQLGTPDEVYGRPATRFVAEFVGSPAMNFWDGRLLATPDGRPAFQPDGGQTVALDGYGFAPGPARGDVAVPGAVLGIRPEALGLEARQGLSAVPATMTLSESLGPDRLHWGRSGAAEIAVRTAAGVAVPLDRPIQLFFDPAEASLFGADGARL